MSENQKAIDPVTEKKINQAADSLTSLLAELLAERLVAKHGAEKEKNANP